MDTTAPKMEARAATLEAPTVSPPRQRPASPGAEDPFRFGFRERLVTTPDGREVFEQIPLTPDDLVYPREGDHVSQSWQHFSFLHTEADAIRRHLEKRPGTVVTSDVTLVLRHDGKNSGPDVAVIEGPFDPSKIKGAINLKAVGGRLVFALEAVSTSEKEIEDKDLTKNKSRYAREGVVDYLTVYPIGGRQVRDLVGWHLEGGDYVEITPDAQGRVYSKKVGLFFQIDAESKALVVIDAETGERLLISDEEEARRRKAEAAHEQEAEARRQEAEARRRAEQRVEQEAEARRQEAEARRRAEQRAEQEVETRRQAEAHGLRRTVEDLCAVLGLAWDAERSAQVERMSSSQLEALRQHLVNVRSWPESSSDASTSTTARG